MARVNKTIIMLEPKIGIILINYKDYAKRFIADCRDSFRKINYPKDKYIVYIVDNATSMESQNYLKEMYPEAIVIPNKENSGWGAGNNRGIEMAFKDGCEDIVLSNMDVYVEEDWLTQLVSAAYSDPTIGVVQSKLFLHPPKQDGTFFINSLGNSFHYLGFGFSAGGNKPDDPSIKNIKDINYSSGASMYVKREVFNKVGLFEENFFMYHDDIEFCFKARQAGYRVVLSPKSVMYHKHEFGRSIRQYFYMERNRFLVLFYFYKLPTLLVILPMIIFMEFGQILFSIKNKLLLARIRVYGYFLNPKNIISAFKTRRKIQKNRVLKKDKNFIKDFVCRIEFQEVNNPLLQYIANPIMCAYWYIAKKVIFW